MIDSVGWQLKEDWDWHWLEGKRKNYRSLIDPAMLDAAWKLLVEKDWFSQQTTNDVDKKISTITPLEGLTNLRSLVLQNNCVEDLRPLSSMIRLKYLNCHHNRIRDLSPIGHLQLLEELSLAENPVASFSVLETFPNLQKLSISTDQVPAFIECKRLLKVHTLKITGDDAIEDLGRFPKMPSLAVFDAWNVKDLAGIERFRSLEALSLMNGRYSSLNSLEALKALTHVNVSTSKTLSVEPLRELYALRSLFIRCRKLHRLTCLAGLPVLHEVRMDDESICDASELHALRAGLTSWNGEFKSDAKGVKPSLDLQVVNQESFDYYDSKMPFGIRSGECNERMLASERGWLVNEIREALSVHFKDEKDFHLPYTSGFHRTERVIIYGYAAYESFREIALAVQRILCETRNEWIIWCQSLLWESPEDQDIPEDAEDFIVWIYPNKIIVTEEHAKVVRKLIEWRN
ncbi:MAG: leucine-rich repeat domain-containing protein [Verrucomicrobia bacterium]|nr:leucine-rich repeat domain-containing protein [Verrucomicrobiota bacterium]